MIWQDLSPFTQDLLVFCFILLPVILINIYISRGFKTTGIIKTMLCKYYKINSFIVIILGITLAITAALTSQERAFKKATAKAADKFDLIVAAPGSKIDMMLATVYLQATDAPLLNGDVLEKLNNDSKVEFAVPIAYGDSFKSYSIVGSTNKFIKYLSDDHIQGSYLLDHKEAVVGASVNLKIGDVFSPVHGHFHKKEYDEHEKEGHDKHSEHEEHERHAHNVKIKVVGKMSLTNSPWDKAIIVPIEDVWKIHGLNIGHKPSLKDQLGGPFDKEYFSGTPAILVKAKSLGYNYSLASKYSTKDTMAFFPGTVLAKLYAVLSDVRGVVSTISSFTIFLVLLSVILTLTLLSKLFSKKFALLRAIGAPKRFIFSLMYLYTSFLIFCASLLGICIGYFLTLFVSDLLSEKLSVVIEANISWQELHLVAAFFAVSTLLGLIPAYIGYKQDILKNLQGS